MIEKKGFKVYKYFGTAIGLIIPISIAWKFELTKRWELLFIVLVLISLFLMQLRRRENTNAVVDIAVTIFGILYISWFFSFIIKLRLLANGAGLVGALVFMTKSGDIGAFLVGSKWGKHPLIARISPKKTIEGALGGLIFSVGAAIASMPLLNFSFLNTVLVGSFIGIFAQVGDLCESLIKRDCAVKDASGIFPGLGGVLDVIDSLLFTAPVFYFYISVISGI
jgi:phosphatidate cytidylyltransferase